MSNNSSEEDLGVIRCICDYEHDDGFTIQCDRCYVWQHAICVGIENHNVPENYLCELCNPRDLDFEFAREVQRKTLEENSSKGSKRRNSNSRKGNKSKNESNVVKKRQYNYRRASRQESCIKTVSEFSLDDSIKISSTKVKNYINEVFLKWSKRDQIENDDVLNYEESLFEIQEFDQNLHNYTVPNIIVKNDSDHKNGNNKGGFASIDIKKGSLIGECTGIVYFKDEYINDLSNYYKPLCFTLPYVFFHPSYNLIVDCRKQGNNTRFIRRHCVPNAILKSYFTKNTQDDVLHLGIFALSDISVNEEIKLPWDIDTSRIPPHLFISKQCKIPQFQSSIKDLIKNTTKQFIEDYICQDTIEHLENINSWIKYIKKCNCDKGLDCRFNRFFKISKKLWKDKLIEFQKNSTDTSSQSNSLIESIYSESAPQPKLVDSYNNENNFANLSSIRLFDEFDEIEKKKVPMYLCKRGLKRYHIHRYKRLETKHKRENEAIKRFRLDSFKETDLIQESILENDVQKLEDKPPNLKEMGKVEKIDLIKKINNLSHVNIDIAADDSSNNTVFECKENVIENTDAKTPQSRPKSKSFSDHPTYDHSTQKKKISLLEYLAKINANTSPEKPNDNRISSLPTIKYNDQFTEKIKTDTDELQKLEKPIDIKNELDVNNPINDKNALNTNYINHIKPYEAHLEKLTPNEERPLNTHQSKSNSNNRFKNSSNNGDNSNFVDKSTKTRNNNDYDDKLDFGENESENISPDKEPENLSKDNKAEKKDTETNLNSHNKINNIKANDPENNNNSITLDQPIDVTQKRSYSPRYNKKDKNITSNDYYYDSRDEYYYKKNYYSHAPNKHYSSNTNVEYRNEYYGSKEYYNSNSKYYYYEDRDSRSSESKYKLYHHNGNDSYGNNSNDHRSHERHYHYPHSYKYYTSRGYHYSDRNNKVESSRYGYLSHPNRERAINKSTHENNNKSSTTQQNGHYNNHKKEVKMSSSPASSFNREANTFSNNNDGRSYSISESNGHITNAKKQDIYGDENDNRFDKFNKDNKNRSNDYGIKLAERTATEHLN